MPYTYNFTSGSNAVVRQYIEIKNTRNAESDALDK